MRVTVSRHRCSGPLGPLPSCGEALATLSSPLLSEWEKELGDPSLPQAHSGLALCLLLPLVTPKGAGRALDGVLLQGD